MAPDNPEAEGTNMDSPTDESPEPESAELRSTRRTGEWRELALCAELDPEVFFPEKGGSSANAKKICAACDVIDECLSHALEHGEKFGIWGGLSPKERQLMSPGEVPGPGLVTRRLRDKSVMELRKHGRSATSIARTTGLNERTVHRIINRAGDAQKSA